MKRKVLSVMLCAAMVVSMTACGGSDAKENTASANASVSETEQGEATEQTIHVLMENHIPFTKSWINIPFFLRRKFHGASQICVINTNRNRYSQARTAIDQMDIHFKKRLVVSNY